MWDLVPWWGTKPRPPTLRVQNLSHWTTRASPQMGNLDWWGRKTSHASAERGRGGDGRGPESSSWEGGLKRNQSLREESGQGQKEKRSWCRKSRLGRGHGVCTPAAAAGPLGSGLPPHPWNPWSRQLVRKDKMKLLTVWGLYTSTSLQRDLLTSFLYHSKS